MAPDHIGKLQAVGNREFVDTTERSKSLRYAPATSRIVPSMPFTEDAESVEGMVMALAARANTIESATRADRVVGKL